MPIGSPKVQSRSPVVKSSSPRSESPVVERNRSPPNVLPVEQNNRSPSKISERKLESRSPEVFASVLNTVSNLPIVDEKGAPKELRIVSTPELIVPEAELKLETTTIIPVPPVQPRVGKQKEKRIEPLLSEAEDQEEIQPFLPRKTKQKKPKQKLAKKLKKEPIIDDHELEMKTPNVEPEKNSKIKFDQLLTDEKMDHLNKLATSLAELLVVIQKETKSKPEFWERFKQFSKVNTCEEFMKNTLGPLLQHSQILYDGMKDESKRKELERIIFVFMDCRKILLDCGDVKESEGSKALEGVADQEFKRLKPEEYLDLMMLIIQDLFVNGKPRTNDETDLKMVFPKDPFLGLAAATGLDPPAVVGMSKQQQQEFVKRVQKMFPNPKTLITTVLEQPNKIDFKKLLPKFSNEMQKLEKRKKDLEGFLAICHKEMKQLMVVLEKVEEENNLWRHEVELTLGICEHDWTDEED